MGLRLQYCFRVNAPFRRHFVFSDISNSHYVLLERFSISNQIHTIRIIDLKAKTNLHLKLKSVHNYSIQVGAIAESQTDREDNQGSSSVVIRVQAGDDVWVSHTNPNSLTYIHGDDQERTSSFMGVLLYEEENNAIIGR